MTSISINDTSTTNNITYYHINIKIPLRTITSIKRYSQFTDLVRDICQDLGINESDFPYKLPTKTSIFNKNSAATINRRKQELSDFLNKIISDVELQNNKVVHEFLQLPMKFKFTPSKTVNIDSNIDSTQWLESLRGFKTKFLESLQDCESQKLNKYELRSKIQTVFTPNLTKLSTVLHTLEARNEISHQEFLKRSQMLEEMKHDLQKVTETYEAPKSQLKSRRVLGQEPQETKDTLPLSNQELMQHQVQIQKQQDSELLELRRIIERQKQIGLTINQEIEEQNEMLDSLNEQVDQTTHKLRGARRKAKNLI